MKRELPRAVAIISGASILLAFFFKAAWLKDASNLVLQWRVPVAAFALAVGAVNLIIVNLRNLRIGRTGKIASVTVIVSLIGYAILGVTMGSGSSAYQYVYNNLFRHLSSTVFSLNAFFIAYACYRAFRIHNPLSVAFLVAGLAVLLGRVGIGQAIWPQLAPISDWIMSVPNTAAQRGIILGSALGAIAVGLRIIAGIERGSYGGAGE